MKNLLGECKKKKKKHSRPAVIGREKITNNWGGECARVKREAVCSRLAVNFARDVNSLSRRDVSSSPLSHNYTHTER